MRFHATNSQMGSDGEYLLGQVYNPADDTAGRTFCRDYRRIATSLIDPAHLGLEPVLIDLAVQNGHALRGADVLYRTCYALEEQPYLVSNVFRLLQRPCRDQDNVVGIPVERGRVPCYGADMLPMVALDLATIVMLDMSDVSSLGWMEMTLRHLTLATLLLRSGEDIMLPATISTIYEEIKAEAFASLVKKKYPHTPGIEQVFASEHEGLATLIDDIVESGRVAFPLARPIFHLDLARAGDEILAPIVAASRLIVKDPEGPAI